MLKYVDSRLDSFFEKKSSLHMNFEYYKVMWKEIFSYLESIKNEMPEEFEYELKRCRDLKNCIDYAREEGINEGRRKARIILKQEIENLK
ncbi:MAG: hypothetical protein HY738_13320 [Bacteroidia bacterium]|nr:hypothetical protein [Bacteroidia bacterium]